MAAIIVTERHLRTRMRGRDLVVQNTASWRSIRGFGGQPVAGKLGLDWSPEQIAGWLKRTHSEDGSLIRCHTRPSIAACFVASARRTQERAASPSSIEALDASLSRPVDPNGDRRGYMKDAVSIRQRPAAVEDRAVPGHWEGDLLSGPNNTYIATLVERQTLRDVGQGGRQGYPDGSHRTHQAGEEATKGAVISRLTWDRGKELTAHRRFTLATNIDVYFCDPQSPWQSAGRNENTNGLLRQYFPQGTDLSVHSASPSEQSGSSAQRTTT